MPPPNTPEEGLASTDVAPALQPASSDGPPPAVVDLRALDYDTTIDENLTCPICRVAMVSPVVTTCDHVFCQKCLVQAHALNSVCPIDRLPLKLAADTRPAPKIIQNQLDNLTVKCPNVTRGCSMIVTRSLVENHVTRYCEMTLVPCPHPSCDKTVARKHVAKGCLHYDTECEYCDEVLEKAELEAHQDHNCLNRKANCDLCSVEYVRHKRDDHMSECPEVEAPCKFASIGCSRKMCRKDLDEHAQGCDYRVVGPVAEQLAELRAEVKTLQDKDRLKDRRIKFLENKGFSLPTESSSDTISQIPLPETSAGAESAPYESRDQYFLSLFETMESTVERLSSALNEVEGRHSMMLFNETLQIKDQLTEVRSTLGVLGMHVRWLMNFRLQERGRVGAVAPTSFTASQDSSGDSGPPRRLSDTMRENPSRL